MINRRQTISLLAASCCTAWAGSDDFGPPIRLKPQRVAKGIYYVQGLPAVGSAENGNFVSNAGIVITRNSVVLIDALGSPALAERLVQAVRTLTSLPISHVIVSHYHADHIYGLQVFKSLGARIIAQRAAAEYLASEVAARRLADSRITLAPWVDEHTRLVPADEWVDSSLRLSIGGVVFELQAAGPAHTADDLVVYLPQQRVLFSGDLFFRARLPFVGQSDSRSWLAALEALSRKDAAVVIPGHGPHSTQVATDLALTRDYLSHLRRTMGAAAREMLPFDEAYRQADWSRFEGVALFREVNRMNAYNTYLLMEQEVSR